MPATVDLQFRPTLIIFVGEGGALVREYLSPYYGDVKRDKGGVGSRGSVALSRYHLLSNLDEPLHSSVALLQVVSEGPDPSVVNPHVAIPFPTLEAFINDPDVPREQGDLSAIVDRALRSIQMDRHMISMRNQGYKVSNTRSQVFIVGEPTPTNNLVSPVPTPSGKLPVLAPSGNKIWMAELLRIVREQFAKYKFEVPVFYFINAYSPSTDFSDTLTAYNWQQRHIANLSFVYEYQIPYPTPVFVNENEQRYATAQALLGLMATGITSSSLFEQEMRIPANLIDYGEQVGNFSTGMVMFPRAISRRFCGSLLGGQLVEKWQQDLNNARVADDVRRKARQDAQRLAEEIQGWISDIDPHGDPRPAAEERLWPSFRILRANPKAHPESELVGYQQRDQYMQLVTQTAKLFTTFSSADITEEHQRYPDKSKTWTSLAYERYYKAEGKFEVWRQQAKIVWNAMNDRTGMEIRHRVDDRWTNGKFGFEVARVFVDELDDQLYELLDQIEKWKAIHQVSYKDDLKKYIKLAEGDWEIGENQPNLQGANVQTAQAAPGMNNIAVPAPGAGGGGPIPVGGGGAGGGPPGPGGPLRARADWKQKQVPPAATLIFAAMLGFMCLVLMLTLYNIPLLIQLVADGALFAAFGIGNMLFQRKRQQQSDEAHEDMLDFYRRYFIFKCESQEDIQRFGLIRHLRGRVGRMRARLDNMATFLATVRDGVMNHAGELNFELFNGPAFARDVFVANGERLAENGSHTLRSIFEKIEHERKNHPVESWHGALDDIRDALIAHVRARNLSLLEIAEDELQETLINFDADIVDDYLVGLLVEIGPALKKSDVWRDVLARVRRPMYTANVGIKDPRDTFICGTPQALASCAQYIPNDAVQVQTKSSEWVMLGSYFRGGTPDMVDAANLFPPK
jgi:hypothetical protein